MIKVVKGTTIVHTAEKFIYNKLAKNGCYILADRDDCEGIVIDGLVFGYGDNAYKDKPLAEIHYAYEVSVIGIATNAVNNADYIVVIPLNADINVWNDTATVERNGESESNPVFSIYISDKISEINSICDTTIANGVDVILNGETKHFSLTMVDQKNILAAQGAVQAGATEYPYHADGELCKQYSAADIITIATAATIFITYHTTYCNHVHAWIKRCENREQIEAIYYGAELPQDLAAHMTEVRGATKVDIQNNGGVGNFNPRSPCEGVTMQV